MFRNALLRGASACALTFALSSPYAALAQEKLPPIEINAAGRSPAARPEGSLAQPAGVSAVVDNPVAERATTSDTAGLLRDAPGVSLQTAGGVSGLPVLDGLADDRLHIEVGGVPFVSACANHMNPPLSYVAPSQVGSIHVYSGVVPVSVGGDSVGGAILVKSPAPLFAQPGQGVLAKGEVGSFFRSNGSAYGGNLSATAATEDFSITYRGSYSRSEDYKAGGNFKLPGPAYLWTGNTIPFTRFGSLTPWLRGDVVGSTAYQAQNHDIAIALRRENHLLEFNLGFQHIPYQLYPNQRMDMTENRAIQGKLHYTGRYDWGTLEAQVYHQTVRHIMDFGEDKQYYYGSFATILAPGMPMDTKAHNTGAKINADIKLTDGRLLRVGGEYQQYRYFEWWPPSPAILPAGKTMGGMAPDTFLNVNGGQRDRYDVFAELESRWNSEWTTQLGVRSDTVAMSTGPVKGYNAIMYDAALLYPATKFNLADRARTDQNWNVTAQTTYTPSATQTYSFGYSLKTRSPNLYERYAWSNAIMPMEMIGWFGDGNFYIGNLSLKPEVSHTISLTADWRDPSGEIGLRVTPYFTYISNYIDVQRCPTYVCGASWMHNQFGRAGFASLQFVNQDARLFGVDASGRALLAKDTALGDFTLKGVLSYVNGQNTTTEDNLYNIMPVNGRLSLEQRLGGWRASVEGQFVGAKDKVSQVRNEVKTSAYALFNLRGSYEWRNIRLDFGVENIFDTLYYLPLGGAYLGQAATMSGPLPVAPRWGVAVPGMGRTFYVATNVTL
ncbi:TonB-dependent receptor [Methylosinus sp. Ce-a6]|uniref:TonB-dependent receptor n=1 Tax=Methylosinus sp. Ce-a6 TaxID=2172005 RepID=UPI00135A1730|nr:TonB-dependent receptor [Methylosinus sp. Ce-a6]